MKIVKIASILVVALLVVACGTDSSTTKSDDDVKKNGNSNSDIKAETDLNEETDYLDIDGIYVGQVDPHTIEVKTEEEILNLQITNTNFSAEEIEEGSKVNIKYSLTNDGQSVLQSIKVLESDPVDSMVMVEEGVYVGQVDPHTIEVKVNEETMNLQTNETDFSFEELEDGSKVKIKYVLNEKGQYSLTDIQKVGADSNVDEGIVTIVGTYTGQVDPHTIQVETDADTLNLQTTEVNISFEEIKEGSHVTIDYYINQNGQNVLKEIEINE